MPYVFKVGNANGILPYATQPQLPPHLSGSPVLDRRSAAYRSISLAMLLLAATEAIVTVVVPDLAVCIVMFFGLIVMPQLPFLKQDDSDNPWYKLQFCMLCILDGFVYAGVGRLMNHTISGSAELVCITTAALALAVVICATTFRQNSSSLVAFAISSCLVLAAAAVTGAHLYIKPTVMLCVAMVHVFACIAIAFGNKTLKANVSTPDPVKDAYDLFLLATFPITAIYYLLSIW